MIILCIRTDTAQTSVVVIQDGQTVTDRCWESGRSLAATLLHEIEETLNMVLLQYKDLDGIIVYEGPGSFTGLRIGITVANAIAYAFKLPIVGASTDEWIGIGIRKMKSCESTAIALPEYGATANVTL